MDALPSKDDVGEDPDAGGALLSIAVVTRHGGVRVVTQTARDHQLEAASLIFDQAGAHAIPGKVIAVRAVAQEAAGPGVLLLLDAAGIDKGRQLQQAPTGL